VLEVWRWAEIRRMKEVEGLSIREIAKRTGHDRNTVRRALRRAGPPRYERPPRPSKLDPFRDEIHRLLQADPRMPGKRIRELIEALGYEGGKTILDDYVREVRPLYERRRTYQRTIYRPGELLRFDLFEPRQEIPVGHGQVRRGYVVTAELGYSRALAGALVFSKEWEDLAFGMTRCLARLGALPETLVWDREGAIHAGGGRPTDALPASAANCALAG
jgi:transposase